MSVTDKAIDATTGAVGRGLKWGGTALGIVLLVGSGLGIVAGGLLGIKLAAMYVGMKMGAFMAAHAGISVGAGLLGAAAGGMLGLATGVLGAIKLGLGITTAAAIGAVTGGVKGLGKDRSAPERNQALEMERQRAVALQNEAIQQQIDMRRSAASSFNNPDATQGHLTRAQQQPAPAQGQATTLA